MSDAKPIIITKYEFARILSEFYNCAILVCEITPETDRIFTTEFGNDEILMKTLYNGYLFFELKKGDPYIAEKILKKYKVENAVLFTRGKIKAKWEGGVLKWNSYAFKKKSVTE